MNFCLVPWRSVWIQMVHEADEVVCHVSRTERIREVARVYLERQRHRSPISGHPLLRHALTTPRAGTPPRAYTKDGLVMSRAGISGGPKLSQKLYVFPLLAVVSSRRRRGAWNLQSPMAADTRLYCGVSAFSLPVSKGEPAARSDG